jgi:hypothetical protein
MRRASNTKTAKRQDQRRSILAGNLFVNIHCLNALWVKDTNFGAVLNEIQSRICQFIKI